MSNITSGNAVWIDGAKAGNVWSFTTGIEAGTALTYFNWNATVPNTFSCLRMLGTGLWVDTNCSTASSYVVEYQCPFGGVFTLTGCSIGLMIFF